MFSERIDKSKVTYSKKELLNTDDNEYWKNASWEEKLQEITYLRECFYGKTATTGRIQKSVQYLKLSNSKY
jgi:hypothetical protein